MAINLRVNAEDVRAIDRLAKLSGANRSDVVRAAIAAVIAEPEMIAAPPLDERLEDDEQAMVAVRERLNDEMRAVEREHFGF